MWKKIISQMQWETENRSMLRDPLIIFLFALLIFLSTPMLMVPFDLFEEGIDYQIVLLLGIMLFFAFDQWNAPLFRVKESGRIVNVFSKYVYTPIDLRVVILAKMALVWKGILILAAVMVVINWGSRILYGGSLLVSYAWIPVLVCLIIGLAESVQILISYLLFRKNH